MIIGICEDNVPIREELRQEIEKQQEQLAMQIYEFGSAEAMLAGNQLFDLVFLDIELDGAMTGLELARQLQIKNPDLILVFISAYTKYVSSAFHLHTFQFLLKPLDAELFAEEFKRCVESYRIAHDIFRIPQGGEIIEVEMKDIMYIESNKRKLIIHLKNKKEYEMYGKISEQEAVLLVHHFIRIHKSYLVNCRYIKKMNDETVSLAYLPKDELIVLPIVSGKKEQEMHGFGISNMKTITKKYRGTFDMQCSDKLFVLNIVLENEEAG